MSNLHLVFGGRVSDPRTLDFNDLDSIDVVGIFPDRDSAVIAWRGAAQRTVYRLRPCASFPASPA
jgi:hypothetical protein